MSSLYGPMHRTPRSTAHSRFWLQPLLLLLHRCTFYLMSNTHIALKYCLLVAFYSSISSENENGAHEFCWNTTRLWRTYSLKNRVRFQSCKQLTYSKPTRNHRIYIHCKKEEKKRIIRRAIFSWCVNAKYGYLNRMVCVRVRDALIGNRNRFFTIFLMANKKYARWAHTLKIKNIEK